MAKDLEGRLDARKIVNEAGMFSSDPVHYTGRGATTHDLNGRILENAYQIIQREHGESAANQYAQMVADIPKLSATNFLLTLYRLEERDWRWNKELLSDGAAANGTIVHVLDGPPGKDQTKAIRRYFLPRHGIKDEKPDEETSNYYIKRRAMNAARQ